MRKQQSAKEIGKERIYILIANALHELKGEDNLANAYARLAKKIAMRLRLRLPYEIRQLYCKGCKNRKIKYKGHKNYLLEVWTCLSQSLSSLRIDCLSNSYKLRIRIYKGSTA
jgi:RNase P subunit RPR2